MNSSSIEYKFYSLIIQICIDILNETNPQENHQVTDTDVQINSHGMQPESVPTCDIDPTGR